MVFNHLILKRQLRGEDQGSLIIVHAVTANEEDLKVLVIDSDVFNEGLVNGTAIINLGLQAGRSLYVFYKIVKTSEPGGTNTPPVITEGSMCIVHEPDCSDVTKTFFVGGSGFSLKIDCKIFFLCDEIIDRFDGSVKPVPHPPKSGKFSLWMTETVGALMGRLHADGCVAAPGGGGSKTLAVLDRATGLEIVLSYQKKVGPFWRDLVTGSKVLNVVRVAN